MQKEKTVSDFLREIGIELQAGDNLLGTDPNGPWQEGVQIFIHKARAGVVLWIASVEQFLDLGQKTEALKKALQQKGGDR